MLTTARVIIVTVTFDAFIVVTVENLTQFNYMTCVHECSTLDYYTAFYCCIINAHYLNKALTTQDL
jgi:hypothetical protein